MTTLAIVGLVLVHDLPHVLFPLTHTRADGHLWVEYEHHRRRSLLPRIHSGP